MNVFEDLVVELQEENLLEKPVSEPLSERSVPDHDDEIHETEMPNPSHDLSEYGERDLVGDEMHDNVTESVLTEPYSEQYVAASSSYETAIHDTEEPVVKEYAENNFASIEAPHVAPAPQPEILVHYEDQPVQDHEDVPPAADVEAGPAAEGETQVEQPQDKRIRKGKEFFKKRAMGEVSSLQMVEHVLTGVEREYLKMVPRAYDDFNAKKALNIFLQVTESESSEEHASAEFTLMQETESWCSALANRDRDILVSSLRQYCERSRPALSSQALLGLARFYRNLPYSEAVRSKFDFVITRLFSRAVAQEKRICLFKRDEMLTHINTLYSDWSSVPLYTADDDESKVMLTALSFDDLAIEAENASVFDQLIESDFFGRLRMFKESISELFYAPQVTAAAIDCNIRIGNAYVELIDRERRKQDVSAMQTKFESIDQMAISEVTGRSLGLEELLVELSRDAEINIPMAEEVRVEPEIDYSEAVEVKEKPVKVVNENSYFQRLKANAFSVNRWFLAASIVLIAASFGLYTWANFVTDEKVSSSGVAQVEIENTKLQEHLRIAKISGETFYGQLLPSWDVLPKEKRQEFLQVVLKTALEKGCTQVNLISKDGKSAAYATATKQEVVMP
ncbi:MAG: hypothetical protein WBC19_10115 [Pyrinomonadaceae bacterium]|nr:hypothetical protein [Pyrinomonadaceae bacterium]